MKLILLQAAELARATLADRRSLFGYSQDSLDSGLDTGICVPGCGSADVRQAVCSGCVLIMLICCASKQNSQMASADSAPDSPLNCDAGNMLRTGDLRGFNSMARLCTLEFAASAPSQHHPTVGFN